MLNDDHVTVTGLPAAKRDPAITCGMNRRAGWRGKIHPLMRAHGAQDRVQARAEKREVIWLKSTGIRRNSLRS